MTMSSEALLAGRDALAHHDWDLAFRLASDAVSLTTSDASSEAARLELLADSTWWLGRIDDCIQAREAAYLMFDELGDHRGAGRCAVWLYEHHLMKARPSIAGGWLRRARRSLTDDPECAEYGALLLREAENAHGGGDLERAGELATRVLELARRLRSADLEAEALQALGRVTIDRGEPVQGLGHLDEAMLFAVEGRLGPYSTGKVYCSLISACEALGDQRRAAEWTEATGRWAQKHPFAIFPGICRVHRAAAMGWRGALRDAEDEALRACDELIGCHVPNAAAAYAEVGDIRRRLGDLSGAEEAFAKATELSGQSCAALALLRLAQGRVDVATTIINSILNDTTWDRLARAKLLPAHAQIAIAAGSLELADASTRELEQIAADYQSASMAAAALTSRGRVQLATKDAAAGSTLRLALARWLELEVPYEAATAHTLLGQALALAGDDAASAGSFAAARKLFGEIGAQLEGDGSRGSVAPAVLPAGLTEREVEVLRLIASGRTNKEVAADLFLSEKTVSRHLSNIFTKIGVSTRSAATAFAFEHRLVERDNR